MSHSFASLIGALAATTLLAGAGMASAETPNAASLGGGYSATDAPLGAPTELRIDLTGHVAARCDLVAPPVLSNDLNLSKAGRTEASFSIDCNAPFTLRVRSSAGGFANETATPGIATLAPYELSIAVRTDDGVRELDWCDADALTDDAVGGCEYAPNAASGGWSSGDATAIDKTGSVRLRWNDQSEGAPLLGQYRDNIIIQLEVRS